MNSEEATAAVIDALDALQIPYMVVGSFSTNFYGIPRATQDADIVVQLEPGAICVAGRSSWAVVSLGSSDVVRDGYSHPSLYIARGR